MPNVTQAEAGHLTLNLSPFQSTKMPHWYSLLILLCNIFKIFKIMLLIDFYWYFLFYIPKTSPHDSLLIRNHPFLNSFFIKEEKDKKIKQNQATHWKKSSYCVSSGPSTSEKKGKGDILYFILVAKYDFYNFSIFSFVSFVVISHCSIL